MSPHKMGFFNSTPMEALIETAEMAPFGDRRASITEIRPIINGTNDVFVSILQRDNLGQLEFVAPETGVT